LQRFAHAGPSARSASPTGHRVLDGPAIRAAGLALAAFGCLWYVLARVAAYRALHHGPFWPVLLATSAWFTATSMVIIAVMAASLA
jgi:hypothetical protein